MTAFLKERKLRSSSYALLIHLDRVQDLGDVVEVETLSEDSIPNEVIEVIAPYLFKKLEGSNEDYMQLNDRWEGKEL
ncbi:hypothetical protein [Paenibacillus dendritiformis]|uniref:hypothetical protein n=1 Tax=Paenibacillus dendritiformis TaxID=130049 RepID=UPI0011B3EFE9|nr:hypothetical protein [Paenibacillus dendritiformis]